MQLAYCQVRMRSALVKLPVPHVYHSVMSGAARKPSPIPWEKAVVTGPTSSLAPGPPSLHLLAKPNLPRKAKAKTCQMDSSRVEK